MEKSNNDYIDISEISSIINHLGIFEMLNIGFSIINQ